MKQLKLLAAVSILLAGALTRPIALNAQPAKKSLSLTVGYFNDNNALQYVKAIVKTKVQGRFKPVANIGLCFYITADSPAYLLGRARTDEKGEAVVFIPPTAQAEWKRSIRQSFVVVSEGADSFDAAKGNVDITKARLRLDTVAGRSVTASVEEQTGSGWRPVKGVEVKIAVQRLNGGLNIGDAAAYTTDSTGTTSAAFKLDSTLPGDHAGNIVLVASVQDNDSYGNLSAKRTVPWGIATNYVSGFDRRSLFARRGRSPLWLEWMAYSIIVVVWGTLFYLFAQIGKLRRLGSRTTSV
ncbi:MAG TPA: hypothetical protein VHE54_09675 [Puia sp.]|nr:hypothetical protein [Puia sp.]